MGHLLGYGQGLEVVTHAQNDLALSEGLQSPPKSPLGLEENGDGHGFWKLHCSALL